MKLRKYLAHAALLLILSSISVGGVAQALSKDNGAVSTDKNAPSKHAKLGLETKIPVTLKRDSFDARLWLSGLNGAKLTDETAKRLKLKGRPIGGLSYTKQKVTKYGLVAKPKATIFDVRSPMFLYWSKSEISNIIGPEALPFDTITMQLSEKTSGEEVISFKMLRLSDSFKGFNLGVGTIASIGKVSVIVQFEPQLLNSYATGTIGRLISVRNGGYYTEEKQRSERYSPVGASRDEFVRKMITGEELAFGALPITALHIRDSSGRDGSLIPDNAQIAQENDDQEMIIVRAIKRQKRYRSYPFLVIGRKHLAHCSSISFDMKNNRIALSCAKRDVSGMMQLYPGSQYFKPEAK